MPFAAAGRSYHRRRHRRRRAAARPPHQQESDGGGGEGGGEASRLSARSGTFCLRRWRVNPQGTGRILEREGHRWEQTDLAVPPPAVVENERGGGRNSRNVEGGRSEEKLDEADGKCAWLSYE